MWPLASLIQTIKRASNCLLIVFDQLEGFTQNGKTERCLIRCCKPTGRQLLSAMTENGHDHAALLVMVIAVRSLY